MSKTRSVLTALAAGVLCSCSCGGGTSLVIAVSGGTHKSDGQTPVDLTATLKSGSTAVDDGTQVNWTITSGAGSFAVIDTTQSPPSLTTTAQCSTAGGSCKVQIYAAQAGSVGVHASATWQDAPFAGDAAVKFGTSGSGPATIQFVSANPPAIALAGSSGTTKSTVTFKVLDATGAAVPDNTAIDFALASQLGGASLNPTTGHTSGGSVSTDLTAGNVAGSVTVVASFGAITGSSSPIAIGGSAAASMTLLCDSYNLAGYAWGNLQMSCTAHVLDTNGQAVANSNVTFIAETNGFMSVVGSAVTDANGLASTTVTSIDCTDATVDAKLAADLDHASGIIAEVSGSAANPGEPFFDDNVNGHWDTGEQYIDVNQNGQYDGPSGATGAVMLWRERRVACTGKGGFTATFSPSTIGIPCNGTPSQVEQVTIVDARNFPPPGGTITLASSGTLSLTFSPPTIDYGGQTSGNPKTFTASVNSCTAGDGATVSLQSAVAPAPAGCASCTVPINGTVGAVGQ